VQTKRSICFHELNHTLLAAPLRPAPLYVFLPLGRSSSLVSGTVARLPGVFARCSTAAETAVHHAYNTTHEKLMVTLQQLSLTLGLPETKESPQEEAVEQRLNIMAARNMTVYRVFSMKYEMRNNKNLSIEHGQHGFWVRLHEDNDKRSALLKQP
jgi:hypothetical protein